MTGPRRDPLTALLNEGEPLVVPGCYDALSAKLVEEAGFEAVYIGSYATSAGTRALPDVGLLTMPELVEQAQRVVDAVGIPVIADAEDGFFDAANIWRTVRAFERAGISAVHLEDHAGGKHTARGRGLRPLGAVLGRLEAAVDARTDPQFTIIARTDAVWAAGDLDEAVRRMRAFAEVGVDLVMVTGISPTDLLQVRVEIPLPVVVVDAEPTGLPQDFAGAADVVLHYGFCSFAATHALSRALSRLRGGVELNQLATSLDSPAVFERRLAYEEFVARAERYDGRST